MHQCLCSTDPRGRNDAQGPLLIRLVTETGYSQIMLFMAWRDWHSTSKKRLRRKQLAGRSRQLVMMSE